MFETIIQIAIFAITVLIVRNIYMNSITRYDKKYKTFWPRFWAPFVDGFILIPFSTLIFIALQSHVLLTTPTRIKDIYDSQYLANNSNNYCYLLFFPVVWIAIELITMLSNKKRRALHDYLAGTVVIRTNIQGEENIETVLIDE